MSHYVVKFLKTTDMVKSREDERIHADMVQADPHHYKFYYKALTSRDKVVGDLIACFPSHVVESVIKEGA